MAKINFNNVILISGSGRNCGKTTVACHIISQLAKMGQVTGLKISPHFHITEINRCLFMKITDLVFIVNLIQDQERTVREC